MLAAYVGITSNLTLLGVLSLLATTRLGTRRLHVLGDMDCCRVVDPAAMRARLHSERGRGGGHTLRPLRLDEHEIRRSNVNRRDDWDFERDTAFAMDCLLPWTKELLDSGGRPTIDSFEAFRWLDTRAPGVYACLAIKKDKSGRIIAVRMKVGCAWSFEGGLKARQRTHLNDEQSKKE